MKEEKLLLAEVYAVCDHFEQTTKRPVLAPLLRQGTGVTRQQLRKWVRDGKLNEYNITFPTGQLVKGYSRPKENSKIKLTPMTRVDSKDPAKEYQYHFSAQNATH